MRKIRQIVIEVCDLKVLGTNSLNLMNFPLDKFKSYSNIYILKGHMGNILSYLCLVGLFSLH